MAGILISAANSEDADGWKSQIRAVENLLYVLQRPGFRGGVRLGQKKSRCSPSTRAQDRLYKFWDGLESCHFGQSGIHYTTLHWDKALIPMVQIQLTITIDMIEVI